MTKAKTNALDALRTLIAERQQYEQWISALDSRREGTPEHVFERVRGDYQSRLERVVSDIRGHAEELQLSISTLSSRLVEVAREEDTRREGLQEAELRAAVGEYEPEQWEQLRTDAERELARIAADRVSLDNQLGELRAIQKLSEVGSTGSPAAEDTAVSRSEASRSETMAPVPVSVESSATASPSPAASAAPSVSGPEPVSPAGSAGGHRSGTSASPRAEPKPEPAAASGPANPEPAAREASRKTGEQDRVPLEPVAAAASNAAAATGRGRGAKTPPGGTAAVRSKAEPAKPDGSKTLKCPECGTPNYPTEWYCERCGGELATM